MLLKHTFVSIIAMSLVSATFALVPTHPPKKEESKRPGEVKAKTESPFSLVAPGTRLVEGEENLNEFYILGKNDPEPIKPKPAVSDVKKVQIYKVRVYKVAVKKPKAEKNIVYGQKYRQKPLNKNMQKHAIHHVRKKVHLAMRHKRMRVRDKSRG